MEPILFWIFSLGMIVAGVSVILNRNPVAAALSLAVTIVFLALMFGFCLGAWFLMVIQVAVYAGAVMVLFLFIIMLLDVKEEETRTRSWSYAVMGSALALFMMCMVVLVLRATEPVKAAADAGVPVDDAQQIGTLLFTKYLLPFEITSVLLLVAAIGVVLLSLTHKRESSS